MPRTRLSFPLLCVFGSLAIAALAVTAHAAPPLPVIPGTSYNVTTYGAVGDGTTDNTTAIQNALNAAKTGGGTVEVPAAPQPYRCGPITVYGSTNLQVDAGATLQALPFGTYPKSTSSPAHFITIATGSTNVEISGGGTIDGDGSAWWTAYNAGQISSRPRLVQINHVDTMLVTGVTLENAPMFHLAFSATNDVTIDGVTISSPANSPNTDGIDPAGQHYLIKNCTISVGDDNIAIKPGSVLCGDLTVTGCAFGTGHGLSIGGQTNVGLDGLTVDHCTFNGTTSGLRLKADATQGGPVQNLTYSNLTMTNVPYPFVFYSYYADVGTPGATSGSNQTTPAKVASWNATPPNSLKATTIPTWRNITISNVTATGATGYSTIWGLPLANALIANVTFNNVQVSGGPGLEIYNAANVQFTGATSFTTPTGGQGLTTYNALSITGQPQSHTVAPGAAVSFSVTAAGSSGISSTAPTYEWLFNGAPVADGTLADGTTISGATTATLTLGNVHAADAGAYAARVSNALDTYDATATTLLAGNTAASATSAAAQLDIVTPPPSVLGNLSVRAGAGTGDQTLTVGFIVSGYGKPVLIRAVGPGLKDYQVTDFLPDPQLTVYRDSTVIGANDNWGTAAANPAVASMAQSVGAFKLTDGSLDSALVTTLDNGGYTAQVTGSGGGIVLAEIYDGTPGVGARLINLSVRGNAGTDADALFAGFVIEGSAPKTVLIRGIGPTLKNFNVSGTLLDPQLTVIRTRDSAQIATNDDWGSKATSPDLANGMDAVGAFALPDGSKDAALLLTLPPDAYTAEVSGVGGTSGVALIEVYDVPSR
ncbi:MAG TPA: glycosyl hydrolase family 28 protein [Opitutaceae bacterium]|nr:glycosyl hydrolase family 28 protein [Opitutaceae bacterium]